MKKDHRFHELLYIPTSTFCPVNDSIMYFYHQFEDVIYSWNNSSDNLLERYKIVYKNGKSIASWEGSHVLKNERNGEYQKWYNDKEYIFGMKNLYVVGHDLFFTVEDKTTKYCVYNMGNGDLQMSSSLLEGFPEVRKLYGFEDNKLVFTLTPEQIIDL